MCAGASQTFGRRVANRVSAARSLVLATLIGVVSLGVGMSDASSPERPVARVSCPAGENALCQELVIAVIEASGGQVDARAVARGDEAPRRKGDLGIALQLDARSDHAVAGYLEWQHGTAGSRGRGPQVTLDVMDAKLTPALYPQLVTGLIRADAALQALLRRDCTCPPDGN